MFEIVVLMSNLVVIGLLSWHCFQQSERIAELNKDYDAVLMDTLGLNEEIAYYDTCIKEIEGERERLQQMWDERPGMVEHRAAESILDALDLLKRQLNSTEV
jgi:hypothetical protein